MIKIMIYTICAILTFISFIGLYHFIVLRPFQPKFYQKVNINEEKYQDIRKYKWSYSDTPFYLFFLIPILLACIIIINLAYFNYNQVHHHKNVIRAWSIFNFRDNKLYYWSFLIFIAFLLSDIFSSKNKLKEKNKALNSKALNSNNTDKIVLEKQSNDQTTNNKNRWLQVPKIYTILLIAIFLIITISSLRLFLIFNNTNYTKINFYIFVSAIIIGPWIILLLSKILIIIINYFYYAKISKNTSKTTFKTLWTQSFNAADYEAEWGYILLPALIAIISPICFAIILSAYQGILILLNMV